MIYLLIISFIIQLNITTTWSKILSVRLFQLTLKTDEPGWSLHMHTFIVVIIEIVALSNEICCLIHILQVLFYIKMMVCVIVLQHLKTPEVSVLGNVTLSCDEWEGYPVKWATSACSSLYYHSSVHLTGAPVHPVLPVSGSQRTGSSRPHSS